MFLCPWVDLNTAKQNLILQKINLKTGEVEYNGLVVNITTRHGENIYDVFINIDPIELVTNYPKYLVLLTEIKPEAILYFVNNFHKSSKLESNPKKCIRNMLENILIILSKKIKEWVKEIRYKGDWKDLPPLITEGEKTLVKSILNFDDKLEINEFVTKFL